MKTLLRSFLLLAGLISSVGATTILDDQFTDGSRTDQNLPSSAAWYSSTTSSNLNVVGSSLQWTNPTTGGGIAASIPSQTLTSGQTLTLSFTFTPATAVNVNNGFRVALLNNSSSTSQITADGWVATNFTATGYGASANLGSGGTGSYLWYRNGSSTLLFSGSSLTPESGTSATGADLNLTAGQTYTGIFTITNNGASNTINYSVLSGSTALISLSTTDSTASHVYTTFDTIAFYLQPNAASSITFSEISLTTSAVPEPGSQAMALSGVVVLLLAALRKRRIATTRISRQN